MLDHIVKSTSDYLADMPKSTRKKKGQFFTSIETARFMAGMFDLSLLKEEILILDPGSGTGILSAALIERISMEADVQKINLTCYETDPEVLPILKNNLGYLVENSRITIIYEIIEEDYILTQADDFRAEKYHSFLYIGRFMN